MNKKCMNLFNRVKNQKWFRAFVIIFLFCIFFARIGLLEQDLAPWGVGYYQPADEGQYALPVINAYNLGMENSDNSEQYSSFVPYNLRTNFIGNTVIKWGLENIGDNYFGLRISSVLFGFLNLLLLFINLSWINRKYGNNDNAAAKWAIVGIIAFLIVDFTFFNASIVTEPTIVRMLFAQILLFVMLCTEGHGHIRFFLLSFLSMLSIGLVYFTNLFFLLACGLLLLLQWKKEGFKKFFQYGIFYVLGMITAGLLAEAYYVKVWNSHFLSDLVNAVLGFSTSAGYEITGITSQIESSKSLIKAAAFYFSSNPFFYCIPILATTLFFVPAILISIFKNKDELTTFLFALPFSFLMQTLFSIDCITRKALIIYPIVICLCFYLALIYKSQCEEFIKTKFFAPLQSVYLLLVSLFIVLVTTFRLFIVSDGTQLDFTGFEKVLIFVVGTIPCIFVLSWVAYDIWRKTKTRKKYKRIYLFCWLIPLCVSPIMFIQHFVLDQSYTERDMQIEFGKIAGDNYVLGAYVSGFTLYNDIKPITTIPQEVPIYMKENSELLFLDYEDETPGMRGYFDDFVFKGSDISAYPVFKGERKFKVYGAERGFYLYKSKPKHEIVKEWRDRFETYSQRIEDFDSVDIENFKELSTAEKIKYIDMRKQEKNEYIQKYNTYNPYPDIYGTIYSSPNKEDVYVDIYGDIYNSMYFDVYGNIYGDIRGDVYGTIEGNIYGTVYGNVYGEIKGTVSGGILGTEEKRG